MNGAASATLTGYELSPQQKRLWPAYIAQPGAFVSECVARIDGLTDQAELTRSLEALIARHEILRTSFRTIAGLSYPVQMIETSAALNLSIIRHPGHESAGCSTRDGEGSVNSVEVDPQKCLLAVTVRQHLSGRHYVRVRAPSIVVDRSSLLELLRSITDRSVEGKEIGVVQYADFAAYANELASKGQDIVGPHFWELHTRGPFVTVRGDLPSTDHHSFKPRCARIPLPQGLVRRLDSLAEEHGLSVQSIVAACWMAVVGSVTGRETLGIGYVCDGRAQLELAEATGLFESIIPVTFDFQPSQAWKKSIRRIQDSLREVERFQSAYPLKLPENSPCYSPIAFGAREERSSWLNRQKARVRLTELYSITDRFDLKLEYVKWSDGARLELWRNSKQYSAGYARLLLARLTSSLEMLANGLDLSLGALPKVTRGERAQLVHQFGSRSWPNGAPRLAHEWFEETAEKHGGKVGVVCGERRMTYGRLRRRSEQLARRLQAMGVGREVRVGVMLERGIDMIVGVLGVMKAGGVYVPIDPSYPRERIGYMVADAEARVVLCDGERGEELKELGVSIVDPAELSCGRQEQWKGEAGVEARVTAANLAYVIYTSGSTGRPKGVMVTHGGLANYLAAAVKNYGVEQGWGAPVISPLSFDLTVTSLLAPLMAGRTVEMIPEEGWAEAMAERAQRGRRYSLVKLTPGHLKILREVVEAKDAGKLTGAFIIGGEALSWELVDEWRKLAPGVRMINEYGPTETVVGCCTYECGEGEGAGVPVGRPLPHTQLYVLDGQQELAPMSTAGELYIGGAGVARGYCKRGDLTAERFVPDAWGAEAGGRLYRSGDRARWRADGELEYLGRMDQQVKLRGYRVEPGEIESVLLEQEGVVQAAVAVQSDASGNQSLAAYVTGEASVERLRDRLRERLPDYMQPSAIIPLPHMPLTPNGKVDRDSLPQPQSLLELRNEYQAPRTKVEATLCRVWSRVLKTTSIGVHDNFFERGGDSILSIQLVTLARSEGIFFTPKQLFQYQTIARLAEAIGGRTESCTPDADGAPVELTLAQRWFFSRDLVNPNHYNQAIKLQSESDLSLGRLRRAVAILTRRHPALRARFEKHEKEWLQFIASAPGRDSCTNIDLTEIPSDAHAGVRHTAGVALQESLDIAAGPVFRVIVFDSKNVSGADILVVAHHLVVDAVSWAIVVSDLNEIYGSLRNNASLTETVDGGMARWGEVLRNYSNNERGDDAAFWRCRVANGCGRVPRDFTDGDNTAASEKSVSIELSRDQTSEFLEACQQSGRAVEEVLVAGVAQVLGRWSRSDRVLVDIESHGRASLANVDISRTVGWFTSIFPLNISLPPNGDIRSVVPPVQAQLRSVRNLGIGYWLAKFSSPVAEEPDPIEVCINFLGRVESAFPIVNDAFRFMGEVDFHTEDSRHPRPYVIDIAGQILSDRLSITWRYSTNLHKPETIRSLASGLPNLLLKYADHSREIHVGSQPDTCLMDAPIGELQELLREVQVRNKQ